MASPEQEYAAAGFSPEQIAAMGQVAQAQTPAQYAAAAQAAGLTFGAQQAAAGQVSAGVPAGPVPAPSFEEQLAQYQQRNQALEAQLASVNQNVQQQLAQLQAQLANVQASVPTKVDPVTETSAKVAQAIRDVPNSDAKNILVSALRSHFVVLGLQDLAKVF